MHALREAATIGLYLSIVILALLVGLTAEDSAQHQVQIIWGTAIGLSLAHLFAFRMTALFAAGGRLTEEDKWSIGGIVVATALIAGIATVPYLLLDDVLDAQTLSMVLLLGVIAASGYASGKKAHLPTARSVMYSGVIVVLALIVVFIKFTLTH